MDAMEEVALVLDEVLSAPRPAEAGRPPRGSSKVAKPHLLESLAGRGVAFQRVTALLGSVHASDWMGVVSLIDTAKERFDVSIEDDAINDDVFATVGTLVDSAHQKVGAPGLRV